MGGVLGGQGGEVVVVEAGQDLGAGQQFEMHVALELQGASDVAPLRAR